MNILAYVEFVPRTIATEALHYCLRALEHAGEVDAEKRDFFFDVPGSEPAFESRALTLAILSQIEELEHVDIYHLDRKTSAAYTLDISAAASTLARGIPGFDAERGEELLRKMRGASQGGWRHAWPC